MHMIGAALSQTLTLLINSCRVYHSLLYVSRYCDE